MLRVPLHPLIPAWATCRRLSTWDEAYTGTEEFPDELFLPDFFTIVALPERAEWVKDHTLWVSILTITAAEIVFMIAVYAFSSPSRNREKASFGLAVWRLYTDGTRWIQGALDEREDLRPDGGHLLSDTRKKWAWMLSLQRERMVVLRVSNEDYHTMTGNGTPLILPAGS